MGSYISGCFQIIKNFKKMDNADKELGRGLPATDRRCTNFRSFTGTESRYDILRFTQKLLWVQKEPNGA
jgi:hypothetical protein